MHRPALAALFLLATLTRPAAAGVDRWTRVGPDAAVVKTLAAAPSRPATVYAGLQSGGVFRSLDGGATWGFAGGSLDLRIPINALAVDARLPDRLWAATDGGIYRSGDGGGHWMRVRSGGAQVLAADPEVSGTVYAPLGNGPLQRSRDAGASWQTLTGAPADVTVLAIDPVHSQHLYAGTHLGLFISGNHGASWLPSRQGLPDSPFVRSLAIDPRSPRTVYLATSDVVPGRVVFRSDDGGASWTPVDRGMLGYTGQVAVEPGRSGALWAVVTGGLFRSPDRGRTWSRADAGLPAGEARTLLTGAFGLLAGTGAGVFQSADPGASWSPSSRGLAAADIQGLALDPLRPARLWAVDWAGNVYRTATGGGRWARLSNDLPPPVSGPLAADPNHPGTLYLGILGAVARSGDAGNHWSAGSPLVCVQPETIAVDPRDSSVIYAAGTFSDTGCNEIPNLCAIFRSDDSGQHWTCIHGNLPGSFTSVLVPDPFQAATVYAKMGDDLYRSTDRGASWSFLSTRAGLVTLAADPRLPGRLWAGGFGVHHSDDGGLTWTSESSVFPPNDPVVALAIDPVDSSVVYAATIRDGVFKTTDEGATWTSLGPGLEGLEVGFLALDPRDRATLYAGTHEGGVLKLRQSGN